MRKYLELCRASNLPTVWTNVTCAVVLSRAWPLGPTLAATLALTLVYLGGMALNDVLDVDEDRVKKPTRPIPSGRITRRAAALFAIVLFAIALAALALFTSWRALVAGAALVATVYLYDSLHGKSAWTVLLMASCRALVFIVSALAVAGRVDRWVLVAAAAQLAYIVALTAIARWEKAAPRSLRIPPIPWLLAGISLVDGVLLAVLVHPVWLAAGIAGAAATRLAQTRVRGD